MLPDRLEGVFSNFLEVVLSVACPGDNEYSAFHCGLVDVYPAVTWGRVSA